MFENNTIQTNTVAKTIGELFEFVYDDDGKQIPALSMPAQGWDIPVDRPQTCPKIDAKYSFRKAPMRSVLNYLRAPSGDGLFLCGPTGSGKTTLVKQIAARLGWGVREVNISDRFEFGSLVGHFTTRSEFPGEAPEMSFVDGPLVQAMENGEILILNEIDLADPGEIAGLNDILEGGNLTVVDDGGRIVEPHLNFRIVATANSNGSGDETGRYSGIKTMNLAFMDRFRVIRVDYPPSLVEAEIVNRIWPLGKEICKGMVELADHVRRGFADGRFSVTLSTRTLLRWARGTMEYRGAPNALREAIWESLLNRTPASEAESILDQCKMIFGPDLWNDGKTAKAVKAKATKARGTEA